MKRTIASVLVAIMTILCIGGGYSESDALNDGIEAEEIIPDQLPEPEQESEEDMAAGDKLVNLDDLKVTYDKQQEDTNALKRALNVTKHGISKYEDTLQVDLTRGTLVNGAINPNTGVVDKSYKYRVSTITEVEFPYAVKLTIASGFKIIPYLYQNNTWMGRGWQTGSYNVAGNTPFYFQIARVTEDTSETADINTFVDKIAVSGSPIADYISNNDTKIDRINVDILQIEKINADRAEKIEVEQGSWGFSNGELTGNGSETTRIRSKAVYRVVKGQKLIFLGRNVQAYINVVSDLFDGTAIENSGWVSNVSTKVETVYTFGHDGYFYMNFRFGDNSSITPSDYNAYAYFMNEKPYNIPEKAVHVYHFGGEGNDWCFVRTPSGYDPDRAKPYPFVICNHGNGWTMDGTIQFANWTKRTMYVPTTDSDYQRDPTEYNGTDDQSLWYSNPTIEALLTAGYIVCGCENYGDALYGNNNCRNACVDFFYHMTEYYNVEDRCYMIGASNGAMTSLNAAYLLQGKVKAMVLQYPLTCLVNQYEHYPNHQAGIRAAYGISDPDITIAELTKAVATHDPLTVDVVDGKKVGVFPPTKLYYSPDDVVVNCNYNALALYTMLDNSNKVVAKVECSGEHGDHTHFAPADYVAWFNAN